MFNVSEVVMLEVLYSAFWGRCEIKGSWSDLLGFIKRLFEMEMTKGRDNDI